MERSLSVESPRASPSSSANDRLKAGWSGRVGTGTVLAVVAHMALFSLWPAWARSRPSTEQLDGFLQLEWVSVLEGGPSGTTEAAAARPLGELADSLLVENALAPSEGAGAEIAPLSEVFRERLVGRLAPVPTVVEQEVERSTDVASTGDSESGSINATGELTAADFAELPGTSPLDLERLTAVRPELVLAAPSAWVLIRNPVEVEQFILRSYRRGALDREANGSVSVALWIDERGSVEWAEISRSSGHPGIDDVALSLFSEVAAFRPARDQGVAVPRSVIFSVRFPWY